MSAWENNKEIQIFREYLKIPSVHPNINYDECVEFLKKQAAELDLSFKVIYPGGPDKPVVIMTWVGREPELPTIVLNSHMDVVPVFAEDWSVPPFSAHMDDEGKIYARGSQDMKCVAMQYLAVIRALKKEGITLKRTIHITFVPDEETGGDLGMREFVKTDDFKNLNVGFSLDEGVASEDDVYHVFYAERSIWHVEFKITGNAGHGSRLLENTVGAKFNYIFDKLSGFREYERKRLEENSNLTIGDVTTVNLTKINGGVQSNVIPPKLDATFDIRLAINVDHDAFESQLWDWCKEAGGGIDIVFEQKQPKVEPTKLGSENIYWGAFNKALNDLGMKTKLQVFLGGTDSRYIRKLGIPAIGFSPMVNTPVLLHDHNEYLKADMYLKGIEIYKKIIPSVANA